MSRSDIMRAVNRVNKAPEIIARQVLHAFGLRFRLHLRDLPGSPELVLPQLGTVILCIGVSSTGILIAAFPSLRRGRNTGCPSSKRM
jgi:G:T-mismatch repair DNA endonuclease (very short patch repair protein)